MVNIETLNTSTYHLSYLLQLCIQYTLYGSRSHFFFSPFTFGFHLQPPSFPSSFFFNLLKPISYHFNSLLTITKVRNCIIVFYCLILFFLSYFGLCHFIHLYVIKRVIILQVKPFWQAGSLYIQVGHCIFKLNMLYIT